LLLLPVVVLTVSFAILVHLQAEQTARTFSSEIVQRIAVGIDRQVSSDLQTSVGVANHLSSLLGQGELSADNLKSWRKPLMRHLNSYRGINSVMFGNPNGQATWVI